MRMRMSSEDESDDKDSMVTIRANNTEENLILHPTDPEDFINANTHSTTDYEENVSQMSTIQTIVEVVNPMLVGDGTATEIAIGKSMDIDESNLPYDEDDIDIVYRREMSLNDKMKNVLKELRENEKVRLSLSRSMDEEEEDGDQQQHEDQHQVNEQENEEEITEKQGANGTVFMVRERLINDFYEHKEEIVEEVENITTKSETNKSFNEASQATIFVNPNAVDEFLANEIRHAQETSNEVVENNSLRARKEALTLNLNQTSTINDENDDDEGEDEGTTPTTPTKGAAGKRKRRKNKNKKK
jgi:hypothetical protein